jgi:hypothetical protein
MTNWERFSDSFFNARVMAEYLPKIVDVGIRPLNWPSSSSWTCSAPCRRWCSSC